MNNFMCFSVGEQITSPSVDSVRFDLTSSGAELVLQLGKPTAKEKNDFKNGVPQFALKVVNDIIFILSRFGTGPWMDAPYYRYRSKPYELSMPTSPNEGINMHAKQVHRCPSLRGPHLPSPLTEVRIDPRTFLEGRSSHPSNL